MIKRNDSKLFESVYKDINSVRESSNWVTVNIKNITINSPNSSLTNNMSSAQFEK